MQNTCKGEECQEHDITLRKRAKGMGIVGAALGMGMMIGPPLGGILASINMVLPFWVATGVILFNVMLVTLLLPETRVQRPVAWRTPSTRRRMFSVGWQKVYRSPSIMRLLLIDLLFALALATVISVFALFTEHHFGWRPKQVGYTLTYLGVLTVLLQGGLIGRLVKYLGEQRLLVLGLLCSAGGLVALSVSHSVAFVLLSQGQPSSCAKCDSYITIGEQVNQDDQSDHDANEAARDKPLRERENAIEQGQYFKDDRGPKSPPLQRPQSPGEDEFQNAQD
jgi:hypothetical protein